MCSRTVYQNRTKAYSETFNTEDPTIVDRNPPYDSDTEWTLATDHERRSNNLRSISWEKIEENRQSNSLQECHQSAMPYL